MNPREIIYKSIDTEELTLSVTEAAQRLGVPRDFDTALTESVNKELLREINCKMAAIRVPITVDGSIVDLGVCSVESKSLLRAIGNAKEAFILAVTIGMGVDRMIMRLSKTSVGSYFIADALSSAFAEAAAERAQELLDSVAKTKKRFSPGYGDLSLSIQPQLLDALNAEKLLGITLSDGLLMKPSKSITAIVGIENE